MKKYYLSDKLLHLVSIENDTIDVIPRLYSGIDEIYHIPEDCVIIFNDKAYQVSSEDLVVLLYPLDEKKRYGDNRERELIIIKSPEYADYISRKQEYEKTEYRKSREAKNCDPGFLKEDLAYI